MGLDSFRTTISPIGQSKTQTANPITVPYHNITGFLMSCHHTWNGDHNITGFLIQAATHGMGTGFIQDNYI